MFSRAKKETAEDQVGLVEIGDQPEEPQKPAKQQEKPKQESRAMFSSGGSKRNSNPKGPSVPSLISSDVTIKGSIETAGEVQLDGVLEGDIRAAGLVIGEDAIVNGEVIADKVKVSGTVEGTIRASKVELALSSVVKGDIIHTSLSIENGARFEGSCRHSDNPQDEKPGVMTNARPVQSKPKTVSAMQEPAPAPSEETKQEASATEEDMDSLSNEAPRSPVLKSLPSGNTPRSSANFLNRGKPDLR